MTVGAIEKDLKLLLVEDDLLVREDVASFLRKSYPSVLLARDGSEGFQVFMERRPDIVLSDIRMPVMSGLEMAKRIREVQDDSAIIMLSAYSDEETLLSSINVGVDGFLKKPVSHEDLRRTITQAGLTLAAVRQERKRRALALAAVESGPLFLLLTEDSRLVYANQAFLAFLGFDPNEEDVCAKAAASVVRLREYSCGGGEIERCVRLEAFLAECARTPAPDRLLALAPRKSAPEAGVFLCRIRSVAGGNGGGDRQRLICLFDVTALEAEKRRYFEQSTRDPLTGAYNRSFFQDRLSQEIERAGRFRTPLALIMLDIDNFKIINDVYGHQAGDHVLLELVRLIQRNVRSIDVVCRFGGEEFLVLTPQTGSGGAMNMAEKLRRLVAGHDFDLENPITCSFGVAELKAGESREELLRRVDMAVYQAKRQGRNRIADAAGNEPGPAGR